MELGTVELTIHDLLRLANENAAERFNDSTGCLLYDVVSIDFKEIDGELLFDLWHEGLAVENQLANTWFSDVALFKLAMEVEK